MSYSFLENDAQKKIFRFIKESDDLNNVPPTLGVVAQAFSADSEVLSLLAQIKKTIVANENKDNLVISFEEFIRRSKFVTLFNSVHDQIS